MLLFFFFGNIAHAFELVLSLTKARIFLQYFNWKYIDQRVFWVNIAKSELNLRYRYCLNLIGKLRKEKEFRQQCCRNSTKIGERKRKSWREKEEEFRQCLIFKLTVLHYSFIFYIFFLIFKLFFLPFSKKKLLFPLLVLTLTVTLLPIFHFPFCLFISPLLYRYTSFLFFIFWLIFYPFYFV